jgi:Uma2 family endonuclease
MEISRPHRFSVEDYYRLEQAGVLERGVRVELLEGLIQDMSPIGPLHGGMLNRLARFFVLAARGRWIVSLQNPVRLDRFSEPQPDLTLLKPAPDDYTSHHPTSADVFLLIELADSSLEYDRGQKLPVYARSGIPEVWIVNLQMSEIEIAREPMFSGYKDTQIKRCRGLISPQVFPDVVLDLAELFARPGHS